MFDQITLKDLPHAIDERLEMLGTRTKFIRRCNVSVFNGISKDLISCYKHNMCYRHIWVHATASLGSSTLCSVLSNSSTY